MTPELYTDYTVDQVVHPDAALRRRQLCNDSKSTSPALASEGWGGTDRDVVCKLGWVKTKPMIFNISFKKNVLNIKWIYYFGIFKTPNFQIEMDLRNLFCKFKNWGDEPTPAILVWTKRVSGFDPQPIAWGSILTWVVICSHPPKRNRQAMTSKTLLK